MLTGKKRYSIGLDIGSHSVRLVKLTGTKEKPVLANFGSIALPKGAVSGGEITDVQTVAESIQTLIKKIGLKEKNVVLGVGNQRVIVRFIDMPYMDSKELASAVKFQAQDFIPIPVEDSIIDYQIIGDYFTESGERFLQLMLVAAHKGMVSLFIEAAEKAGLKPEIIDVNAFAIIRALEKSSTLPLRETKKGEEREALVEEPVETEESYLNQEVEAESVAQEEIIEEENEAKFLEDVNEQKFTHELEDLGDEGMVEEVDESAFESKDESEGPPKLADGEGTESLPASEKEVVAYLDIGADVTNLCIVEDGVVKFVRVIGIGGDDWTEGIVEILGVTYDEAEEMKVKIGLPPLTGDRYLDVPGTYLDVADRVFSILEKEVIRFIGEIRRSFEYYLSQSAGNRVTRLVFSGGSSSLKNIGSYLEKGLDVYVERRDPFEGVVIPARIKDQLEPEERLSYTIAVGLAMRGFEG